MTGAVRRYSGKAVGLVAVLVTAIPPYRLTAQDTIPIGFGTLKRDDIVVRFATAQVEIQVLPLAQSVIRLLLPDTYRSLSDLIKTKRAQLDDAAQRAGVQHPTFVMVSFYGLVPQARFVPEDINITSRGQLFRPVAIVPLSPTWNGQQLDARQQAVALYLFDEGISFREALSVSYQGLTNDGWSRGAMRALERERARVLARAQSLPNQEP
ncbi:MAG TPA: hypothetical protein VF890_05870 [Gemmatimonadales bacterium]